MEKKGTRWVVAHAPFRAGIGRNGFALPGTKREGDGQSPSGLFRLGKLFSYEEHVNTAMPFIQTTAEDKWIDDPNSPDYNQHIRGLTEAKSFEKLKISSDEYKYCMVIEYNMQPVIKGMGSAIFLHLSQGKNTNPSAGCVVITPSHMEQLLKWMKPELKPSILMGNYNVLMSGL
jgi:L,D-peptidoglycan transpeptidase YkuD (ErfK/YbiS/YcfS/YnhG family)